ncbi:MAG: DEAD/DEAH box helicase [Spirochaeta sp.]
MSDTIHEAQVSEVLFIGTVDSAKLLTEVYAAARGNSGQVPAPPPHTGAGNVVIHNHPSGILIPSPADLRVAAELGEMGIGFYIINNSADEVYVVVEPLPPKHTEPLDIDTLSALIDDGGTLGRFKPGFEPRQSQISMLRCIAEGFNNNGIEVIEAGTGVGKSFAYLIPAIAWAAQNDERVVISTATINLQQQLMEKDIPMVQRLLGTRLKTVLVKGRSNYLCSHRLEEHIAEKRTLFDTPPDELMAISEWSAYTKTGDKTEMPFLPDPGLWSNVCADPDACSGRRCRSGEPCFIVKARREAAAAQILVANHHLLFADLAMRTKGFGFEATVILPPFQRLILDEAHNIERSATSYFSESFNRFSLQKYLRMLYRKQRNTQFGALVELEALGTLNPAVVPPLMNAVQKAAENLESSVQYVLGGRFTMRIFPHPEFGIPAEITEGIFKPMLLLKTAIGKLTDVLAQAVRDLPEEHADEPGVIDVRLLIRRLEGVAEICSTMASGEDRPELVFWLERRTTSKKEVYTQFSITPLNIAHMMQEAVFEPLSTVACTSATLTIRDSFRYIDSRIGLGDAADDRIRHHSLPSPFAYHERVLLGIPTDASAPTDSAGYN